MASFHFKVLGGQLVAVSCNVPSEVQRTFGDMTRLGYPFQQHAVDEVSFVDTMNRIADNAVHGRVSLPHGVHLGPMLFRVHKQRVMMDVNLIFREHEGLPETLSSFLAVMHITK